MNKKKSVKILISVKIHLTKHNIEFFFNKQILQ